MTLEQYTLTASGGTYKILSDGVAISTASPITLSASFAITTLSSPQINFPLTIRWNANVTLGVFGITIGGIAVPQDQVNQRGTFELMYDGTGYTLQYFPDFTQKPQENYGVTTITVPSGGGTLTIAPGTDNKTYVLQGSVTLSSNYTVNGSTSGVTDGSSIRVVVSGGITTGSNTVTIFGKTISKYDCLNGGIEVFAEFNATTSTYVATYVNKPVPLGNIDTTGFVSGDNGKLATYNFASKEFVASFLSASSLPSTFKVINIAETYITSGQLLTSNTTPITLLPASGSISTVEIPLMIVLRYKYGTTTYATNTTIDIKYTGPGVTEVVATKNCLGFTVTGIDFVPPVAHATPVVRITPNYSLQLSTRTGNPTTGDGDLVVYVISTTLNI